MKQLYSLYFIVNGLMWFDYVFINSLVLKSLSDSLKNAFSIGL